MDATETDADASTADAAPTVGASEAAAMLNTTPQHVREMIHAGRLPASRDNYRAPWVIERQDVLDYAAGRLHAADPELVRELGPLTDAVEAAQQALEDALAARADVLIRRRRGGKGPTELGAAARLTRQRVRTTIVKRRAQLAEQAEQARTTSAAPVTAGSAT